MNPSDIMQLMTDYVGENGYDDSLKLLIIKLVKFGLWRRVKN